MQFQLSSLSDLFDAGFDDLIDARSPAEYAEDHLPGAISLPVLDNDERAQVGTMYVRQSSFGARRVGAAQVLRNVANHLDGPLADRPGGWRPLVYCWRGGQRSGTFGWLMREIGWPAQTLAGGYRSYRRLVVQAMYDTPLRHRIVVLAGMTCTAKTVLLHKLAGAGAGMQVLDLEGIGRHRGSIFGAMAAPQPSQRAFEGEIALRLARFDPTRALVVEAESSKVGDLIVPPVLWAAMCAAPRVEVAAPLAARAAHFPQAYPDLVADPVRFAALVGQLRRLHGRDLTMQWQAMIADGDMSGVAAALMTTHYDPRYGKSQARYAERVVARQVLDQLDDAALEAQLPALACALDRAARGNPPAIGGT